MKISIKLTREENAGYYGVSPGDVVSEEFETYVAGVVASEIGNSHIEACRAQATAARSFAANKGVPDGKVISDASSTDQAYRAKRANSSQYPNASQAARDTAGIVLTYKGKIIPAVYSACNGGRTVSSKERWGSERSYLPAQDDPWDDSEKRAGHGVGMSQRGAKAMAAAGKTWQEILGFYYPGTDLTKLEDKSEGSGRMVSAAEFVEKVKIPLDEGWGYIYGTHGILWTKEKQAAATREQTVKYGSQWIGHMVTDCSGLVYWACMELGEKVVHHATYLYTDWSKPKGKLVSIAANEAGETKGRDDGKPIRPGTLVFIKGTEEKIHHVGVYVGGDTVIEAKGTKSGVVTSRLSHWEYWGELKVLDYTGAQAPESEEEDMVVTDVKVTRAVVTNPNNWLNVRSGPGTGYGRRFRAPKGATVTVRDDTSNPEWWQIEYNGQMGWAMAKYLTPTETAPKEKQEESKSETVYAAYPDDPAWPEEPVVLDLDEEEETEDHEKEEAEEPEEEQGPVDVVAALNDVKASLDFLTHAVDDAMKVRSLDELVTILQAMDKILPEIEALNKAMWCLVTVG